jgi:hypothetical protein
MGFIKTEFNLKRFADALRAGKGVPVTDGTHVGYKIAQEMLTPYIFERLYIPILRDGVIPIAGLDFSLLTDEVIDGLESALSVTAVENYIRLGFRISELAPSAARKSVFI